MTTRPYIIRSLTEENGLQFKSLAVVEASSQRKAERIYGATLFFAETSTASEVLQAMRDGVPVIEAKKG